MTSETDTSAAAWIALFRAQKRAGAAIGHALGSAGLPPLEWYDVLWALEGAMPGGLRPFELEDAVLLPQHGISRLTARMTAQGLLERLPCPDDKRGFRLRPSPAGLKLRQQMWQVYQPVIQAAFAPRLSQAELQALTRMLAQVAPP